MTLVRNNITASVKLSSWRRQKYIKITAKDSTLELIILCPYDKYASLDSILVPLASSTPET